MHPNRELGQKYTSENAIFQSLVEHIKIYIAIVHLHDENYKKMNLRGFKLTQ
jgi:hypothetical protein